MGGRSQDAPTQLLVSPPEDHFPWFLTFIFFLNHALQRAGVQHSELQKFLYFLNYFCSRPDHQSGEVCHIPECRTWSYGGIFCL